MLNRLALATALISLAAGTAGAGPRGGEPAPGAQPLHGGYVVKPLEQRNTWAGSDISKIIYLDRCIGGCTITPGTEDARASTSGLVDGTTYLSEFQWGDTTWNEVVACLRDIYKPFDVEITETDPSPMFHHRAIIAGTNTEFGDMSILGVAPLYSNGSVCIAANNVISFTLANSHTNNAQYICETAAQEMAHAFGLDHEHDCHDPMTYLPGCSPKYYRDASFDCGRIDVEPCLCGGLKQNSHRKLMAIFGPGPGVDPPAVDIPLPADGATVENGFTTYATANDVRGNLRAELRINGYRWLSADADQAYAQDTTYRFALPGGVPDGYLDIDVRAYNDLSVAGDATITVLKGAPCTSAATCADGQSCNDGRCAWPPPTGELGDPCTRVQDCISDLCPANGGEAYCSQECIPGVADGCPEGFDCLQAGVGQGFCWPAGGGGGGCCSVEGSRGGHRTTWLELGLFAAVMLLVSTRRRRRG